MVVSSFDTGAGCKPVADWSSQNSFREMMRPKARARLVRASQVQARSQQLAAGEG
jgi:hypothetical protein